ncbi:hypothetical protein ACTXT7_012007 [Hymenolepis weldensis]
MAVTAEVTVHNNQAEKGKDPLNAFPIQQILTFALTRLRNHILCEMRGETAELAFLLSLTPCLNIANRTTKPASFPTSSLIRCLAGWQTGQKYVHDANITIAVFQLLVPDHVCLTKLWLCARNTGLQH